MKASYFDGVDARLHNVTVAVADGQVAITGAGVARQASIASTRWSAVSASAPAMLYLADGSVCEVHGHDRAALARALGRRTGRPLWRYLRTLAAVLMVAVLAAQIALVAWRVYPAVANAAVQLVPARVDQRLGQWSLASLIDDATLQPSRIAPGLAHEARQVLAEVTPAHPRLPVRLHLAYSPKIGVNAMALPDGTIVVTDQLIRSLAGRLPTLRAPERAALAGILAHEIGHIQARDSMHGLVASSLMQTMSATVFGDFDDLAKSSAGLVRLHYARGQEAAADSWAIDRLKQLNLPLTPLAQWLDGVEAWYARLDNVKPGAVPAYLDSHPLTAERTARMRAADQGR